VPLCVATRAQVAGNLSDPLIHQKNPSLIGYERSALFR
jgi:hypothetical protein